MGQRRAWLDVLAGQLQHAAAACPPPGIDIDLTVFQLDAALNATNTALRLDESGSVEKLSRVIDGLLPPNPLSENGL